jgi:hypothetical protein
MRRPKTSQPRSFEDSRERIADNLPRRLSPGYRNSLALTLIERIQGWCAIEPEIAPYRDKLKRLTRQADKFGEVVTRIKTSVAKLGTDPAIGLHRNNVESHLYMIASRALDEINGWNRVWRPGKARPAAFSVQLTKVLQEEYRLYCGNTRGFSRLLTAIQDEFPRLPPLSVSAIEKRSQRRRLKRL